MSQLNSIIHDLIDHAKKHEGVWYSKKLAGGMSIRFKRDGEILRMELRRDNGYPSDVEWSTILNRFPWPVLHKPPTRGPSYTLTGNFIIMNPMF